MFFGKKWLPFVRRFFKLSKGFPLPKNGSPKPLVVVAQADPAGRLLVTSNVWGMKKSFTALNQLGVVFFCTNWMPTNGGTKQLGVLLYKND